MPNDPAVTPTSGIAQLMAIIRDLERRLATLERRPKGGSAGG